jgi:hypothetical protein
MRYCTAGTVRPARAIRNHGGVEAEPTSKRDVVVVTRVDVPMGEGDVRSAVADSIAGVVGLVGFTVHTAVTLTRAVASSAVNGGLDRLLPPIIDAIISRIDLTDVVLARVDLRAIVLRALDEIDLTAIVVDRVDLDVIINQIPIVEIADYVINEIDLPELIRQSTGGVAVNALNATRMQAADADAGIATVVNRILFRSRSRHDSAEE